MSIVALKNSSSSCSSSMQRSVFMQPCRGLSAGRGRLPMAEKREAEKEEEGSCSPSSSIGTNSDEESAEDCKETEVESSCQGPLDTMDALEEGLPIKRGISKFYFGKSKSFTSLADASSASSIKDFAKPENPYNRKRKNLLFHDNLRDMNQCLPPKGKGSGLSKRPANSNRSTLTPVLAMSYSKSTYYNDDPPLILSASPSCLPPLHLLDRTSLHNGACSPPSKQSYPWRSFSLSDLRCAAAATSNH